MKFIDYLIALGCAAGTALILVLIILISQLISWALVWALLVFALIPLFMKAVQFYKEHDCYDLEDFFIELKEKTMTNKNDNTIH